MHLSKGRICLQSLPEFGGDECRHGYKLWFSLMGETRGGCCWGMGENKEQFIEVDSSSSQSRRQSYFLLLGNNYSSKKSRVCWQVSLVHPGQRTLNCFEIGLESASFRWFLTISAMASINTGSAFRDSALVKPVIPAYLMRQMRSAIRRRMILGQLPVRLCFLLI